MMCWRPVCCGLETAVGILLIWHFPRRLNSRLFIFYCCTMGSSLSREGELEMQVRERRERYSQLRNNSHFGSLSIVHYSLRSPHSSPSFVYTQTGPCQSIVFCNLIRACQIGDLDVVTRELDAHPRWLDRLMRCQQPLHRTPLMYAAERGQVSESVASGCCCCCCC